LDDTTQAAAAAAAVSSHLSLMLLLLLCQGRLPTSWHLAAGPVGQRQRGTCWLDQPARSSSSSTNFLQW
jgi:hypothetical protein